MEKSKVYYTDFHTRKLGEGLPTKLQLLAKKAGIANLDLDGKFVAIKMHFGELGNIAYLRPNYARAIVDVVKELGGKPFLTDCIQCIQDQEKMLWNIWSVPGKMDLLHLL